jgi:integral membrane protein (TIGR01906 family)
MTMIGSDVARQAGARTDRAIVRVPLVLLVLVVALAVPPILVVNGLRVLATDTFVRFEYGRDGFPSDRYGLTREQRTRLALLGLESISPGGRGVDLLRAARLPDGSAAFDQRELRHMEDVRSVFGAALRLQLVAMVAIAVLALVLARTRRFALAVPTGLLAGALATLAVAVLAVPVILLGFDSFFVRFHEIFFEADTWRFSSTDTLLRLYPEIFWQHTSQLAATITVLQAVLLAGLAWWWLRTVRRRRATGER